MTMTYDTLLAQDRPGVLFFGGARMALLDVEAGFWALRRQMEALVGPRLTDGVLQQAGANGGASFARAFAGGGGDSDVRVGDEQLLHACIAAYQAAGFGQFEVVESDWPLGHVLIHAHDAFEAWAARQHGGRATAPVCAYTAGVLVGFVNVVAGRRDVVCVEHACQAEGAETCLFELLPAEAAGDKPVVAFAPDPALGKQLNLLETLFDRMPMGIAVLDPDYRIQRYNPTWKDFAERYASPSAAALVPGVGYFDHLPGTEDTVVPLFARVLAGETIRQEAVRLESAGIVTYWDVVLAPIVEGQEVTGILNVTIDATGRVRANQELGKTLDRLRQREERLALVMEGINDGVWDWDIESDEVYYSSRWKSMLGYADDEIADRIESWERLVHPDDRERAAAALRKHLDGRTALFRLEHRLRHKNGQYRWILARGKALRRQDGTAYRLVGSHTDVTARRLAEEALHYRAVFENVVSSISTDFINMPLDEINRGIHRALRTIGQFTGVDRSYVFRFSEDRAWMTCTHEWSASGIEPQIDRLQNVPVDKFAWSNRQLLRGESLHVPRVADLPSAAGAERQEFQRQGVRSLVAVPMVYRGATVGFAGFDSVREEKTWSQDSIQLLGLVAGVFVNALEHQRAQAIQEGQRHFLELLATGGEFSETLHTLVRLIEELWPGMLGLVLLLDEDGRHLHVGASISLPQKYVASIEGLEIGPRVGSCGTASYLGERVIVEDIDCDERWEGLRDLAQAYGLRACWSEPVISPEGEVLGTFAMYYRHPRAPTEAELRTIEMAAHLVGIAVEHRQAQAALQKSRRQLEQRVRERTRELSTLLDVSHNVSSTLDLDTLLELVLDQLRTVVDYAGASILTLDDGHLAVRAHRGPISQDEVLSLRFPLAGAPANREVVHRQEPVIIPDVRDDTRLARLFHRGAGDALETTFGYVRSWLGVPLLAQDRVLGMLTLDHEQPDFFDDQHAGLVQAFANQVAVAIENARLYQAEQERFEESERRRQVAEGLRGVLSILNSDRPLHDILDYILQQACELLGAQGAVVYRLAMDEDQIEVASTVGMPPEFDEIDVLPYVETEPNRATLEGQPIAISDVQARWASLDQDADEQDPAIRKWISIVGQRFSSYLAAPILVQDQSYGSVSLFYDQPHSFSAEEIQLATAFADQAALAIENARLRIQAQQAAVAAERTRLARDLHDAVTQTLFSSSLIADVLPRIWDRNPEEGQRRLAELRELTRGALAEMRTLLLELRPSALIDAKLRDLLRQLAESVTGRARVPVRLEVEGDCEVVAEVKVALYRIAQEALNNVAKHAGASEVLVRLLCQPGEIKMCVCDDGLGFDPSGLPPDSLGLGIMRERAFAIGAQLTVESQAGEGTQVRVSWPAPEGR
jgi:PAS domain S-box-containing protein